MRKPGFEIHAIEMSEGAAEWLYWESGLAQCEFCRVYVLKQEVKQSGLCPDCHAAGQKSKDSERERST